MKIENEISNYRKNKKISKLELSKILKCKESDIDKLEDGSLKPNIYQINKISKLVNKPISLFVDSDEIAYDLIKEKRYNSIKMVVIFVLIIMLLLLFSLFIHVEKYQEMEIHSFSGKSENFEMKNGLIVLSRDNKYIELSNFNILNDIELKSATINIAFNEKIWLIKDYDINEDGDSKEWFKEIYINEYQRKAHLFASPNKQNSFSNYETKFPYDFKVEINYCTIDDICTLEILDIESSLLNTSNTIKKK